MEQSDWEVLAKRILPYSPFIGVCLIFVVYLIREWVGQDVSGRLLLGAAIGFVPLVLIFALVALVILAVSSKDKSN